MHCQQQTKVPIGCVEDTESFCSSLKEHYDLVIQDAEILYRTNQADLVLDTIKG